MPIDIDRFEDSDALGDPPASQRIVRFLLGPDDRVRTLLGVELVRPGAIPRGFGRFYNDVETYRRQVDYGTGDVERDAGELIERTEAFLDVMRDVVDESG